MNCPTYYQAAKDLIRPAKVAGAAGDVYRAAQKTDTGPSEAQIESGNYRKGSVNLNGFTVKIENPKGSTRSGTDPDGNEWSVKIKSHYGYFARQGDSKADGDPVDVFIGPEPESELVFGIDQVEPRNGRFDEHKIMFGYVDEASARKGYLENYDKGWKGLKDITPMTVAQFRTWLEKGDTGKPLAGQIKQAGAFNAAKALRPLFSNVGQAKSYTSGIPGINRAKEIGIGLGAGAGAGLLAPHLESAVAGGDTPVEAPHRSSAAIQSAVMNALLAPLLWRRNPFLVPALATLPATLSGIGKKLGGEDSWAGLRATTQGLQHIADTLKDDLQPAAKTIGSRVGKHVGGGIAGSLGGFGLGKLLSTALIGPAKSKDIEFEDPEEREEYYRRRRKEERLRSAINMIGSSLGGLGGVAAVNRLSKQSNVDVVPEVEGVESPQSELDKRRARRQERMRTLGNTLMPVAAP